MQHIALFLFFFGCQSLLGAASVDRCSLIVPDELLHFPANVRPPAAGEGARNGGENFLPPWRCRFPALRLAACQTHRTLGRGGVDREWPPDRAPEERSGAERSAAQRGANKDLPVPLPPNHTEPIPTEPGAAREPDLTTLQLRRTQDPILTVTNHPIHFNIIINSNNYLLITLQVN